MAKRALKPLLGLLMTGLFLWLLLRGLSAGDFWAALQSISLHTILIALLCLASGYALRIWRWALMLQALQPDLPVRACVWPFLSSIAVNNVLPLRAGDVLRVVGFRRQLQAPAARLLGTLVIERLLDLTVLLAFFFSGLRHVPEGVLPAGFVDGAEWLVGITVLGLLGLIALTPALLKFWPCLVGWPRFRRLPGSGFIAQQGEQVLQSLTLLNHLPRALLLLLLSVLLWSFEGAVFASIATDFGQSFFAGGPWFALPTGTLATLIPSSPGYIGTFDYFAAQGLVAFGAAPALATAFALCVHAVLWIPLTVLGLGYLAAHGFRMNRDKV